MPTKYSKSRKTYRRKRSKYSWNSVAGNAKWAAQRALKGFNYLKSLINVEKKFLDVTNNNQAIGSSPVVYPLTQMATGDDYKTRDGNSIKASSILIRLSAVLDTSAEQTFVRMLLVRDMEQNTSTPAGSDILESNDYLSPISHVNGKRFYVMCDKYLNLTKTGNSKMIKCYKKLYHHIRFSSSSSTDTREGNLYLLLISDQAVNTPTIDFTSRLRYIDN